MYFYNSKRNYAKFQNNAVLIHSKGV